MSIWALLADIVIMSLLGATIFYSIRLSKNLEHFRQTRDDLQNVIGDLSTHVERAQHAVEELRSHAGQSAINLQTLISRSEEIADELELMTGSADALANRLEGLATRATAQAEANRPGLYDLDEEEQSAPAAPARNAKPHAYQPVVPAKPFYAGDVMRNDDNDGGPFSIRDREYEDEEAAATGPADWEDDDPILALSSQAERDLATALRRRRGNS